MLVDYDDSSAVVIDAGAHSIRAGFSGDDQPTSVFPANVGIANPAENDKKLYMGTNELNCRRESMEIKAPLLDGNAVDWDLFEALLHNIVEKQLATSSNSRPLLIAMPPYADNLRKEKTLQLCFDLLDCPAVFEAKTSSLAAFAVGQHTALVVDSGHSATCIAPVHEGYVLTKGCTWNTRAGHHLSLELLRTLEAGSHVIRPRYSFTRKMDREGKPQLFVHETPNVHPSYTRWAMMDIAEAIKEAHFMVPPLSTDSIPTDFQEFHLPDGTTLPIGEERGHIPAMLFGDGPLPTLHDMALQSIQKCDPDARQAICKSMVLVGGTTLIDGFVQRFENEVLSRAPSIARVRTPLAPAAAADRKNAVWLGGSILGSLGTFQQLWISRAEYQEVGVSIVHKKCP